MIANLGAEGISSGFASGGNGRRDPRCVPTTVAPGVDLHVGQILRAGIRRLARIRRSGIDRNVGPTIAIAPSPVAA
jgi:hypothetical protein